MEVSSDFMTVLKLLKTFNTHYQKYWNTSLKKDIVLTQFLKRIAEPNQLKYWHLAHLFDAISFHHFYKS